MSECVSECQNKVKTLRMYLVRNEHMGIPGYAEWEVGSDVIMRGRE